MIKPLTQKETEKLAEVINKFLAPAYVDKMSQPKNNEQKKPA